MLNVVSTQAATQKIWLMLTFSFESSKALRVPLSTSINHLVFRHTFRHAAIVHVKETYCDWMSGHELGSFHWLTVVGDPELNRWRFVAAKEFLERQRTQRQHGSFNYPSFISKPWNFSESANLWTCCEDLFLSSSKLSPKPESSKINVKWFLLIVGRQIKEGLESAGQHCTKNCEVVQKEKTLWLSGVSWWCFSVLISQ